jgi:sigma-E factor negative regulatory protein RseB
MTCMRQTQVVFQFVVAVISCLFAFSVHAQSANSIADKRDAQAWLKKIQTAAKTLNYSGTFVYQQANQVRTSRITHIRSGKNEIEKLEILDGKQREYIRRNNEIISYVPDTKTLLIEKRVAQDVFPAMLNVNPASLTDHYQVRKGGTARIAGYSTQAIILEPRDNLRYGYKLWAEKKSGLLLRAQTINQKVEVVEQISFSQIQIGGIHRNRVKPTFTNTQGWHVENAVMRQMKVSGWSVKSLPPGFKKIREVQRLVSDSPAVQASNSASAAREVSQIVFSDGLAAISVFIEPSSSGRTEGYMQQGAVNIVGKRQGDFWLTIVGEVPLLAIRQVANSIEFKTR